MDSPMQEMMNSKCADPDLQLDVDVMTLDYLIYKASTCVLDDRRNQQGGHLAVTEVVESTERNLNSVNSYIEIFKQNHPPDTIPPTTQFRLDLLKFTILLCRRLFQTSTTPPGHDTLASVRRTHRHRAQEWNNAQSSTTLHFEASHQDELPLPGQHLQQCRDHVLSKFGVPRSDAYEDQDFYGTEASVSLLDLLPFFMQVSASRSQLDADFGVTKRWMQLAGEFMLQATLESILCFGFAGSESVVEAFAWGYVAADEGEDWQKKSLEEMELDVDSQLEFDESGLAGPVENEAGRSKSEDKVERWGWVDVVNKMFRGDPHALREAHGSPAMDAENREIEGWREVRDEYLNLLQPPADSPLVSHLIYTAAEYPLFDFESKILSYVEALSQSIEAPILVQLERGQLAALDNSVELTNKFKQKVGLDSWVVETAT